MHYKNKFNEGEVYYIELDEKRNPNPYKRKYYQIIEERGDFPYYISELIGNNGKYEYGDIQIITMELINKLQYINADMISLMNININDIYEYKNHNYQVKEICNELISLENIKNATDVLKIPYYKIALMKKLVIKVNPTEYNIGDKVRNSVGRIYRIFDIKVKENKYLYYKVFTLADCLTGIHINIEGNDIFNYYKIQVIASNCNKIEIGDKVKFENGTVGKVIENRILQVELDCGYIYTKESNVQKINDPNEPGYYKCTDSFCNNYVLYWTGKYWTQHDWNKTDIIKFEKI